MNTRHFALALALAAVCAPWAQAAKPPSNSLVMDCNDMRLPTQRQVAELVGSNNSTYTHRARTILMQVAHRACRRAGAGVGQVRFVPEPQQPSLVVKPAVAVNLPSTEG